MNNSNDFTYDHENFKDLPGFVKELHQRGMHYIPLVDPGISASEAPGTYPPYDKAIEMDILVKNSSGRPFIGKVGDYAILKQFFFSHTISNTRFGMRNPQYGQTSPIHAL